MGKKVSPNAESQESKEWRKKGKMAWSVEPFKGQKYSSIRKEMLKTGELFIDPEFPANNKSLFYSKVDPDIEWKRPQELCKVPKLVVDGATCDDLNEGELGNSWFVTACSCICLEPKLFNKVIPNWREQDWVPGAPSTGIFHFQFWRYGGWVDVVIDDLLPTKNNQLVFCHSKSRNEFWSALIEKAYAKLFGDYETLAVGRAVNALVDFTGGVAERLYLPEMDLTVAEKKFRLFKDLRESSENNAMMSCRIECEREETGTLFDRGLLKGHGYVITDVKEIKVNKVLISAMGGEIVYLLRLRNPWGVTEHAWDGAWSENSEVWGKLTGRDREKMGIRYSSEGEFWMCYDDFLKYFSHVDVCHFVNTAVFTMKKSWNEAILPGEWTYAAKGTQRDRCGGSSVHVSFLQNPQYMFDITGLGDTVMISLEQDDATAGREIGAEMRDIGFHVMQVEDNRKYRVNKGGIAIHESKFVAERNVFDRITIRKGRYVVIPSTKEPAVTGRFLLRMYTGSNTNAREVMKDCPSTACCVKPYGVVTTVKVVKAEGLETPPKETLDPYVIIKGERDSVKSHWIKNTNTPEWNTKAIFYRKKSEVPITVEVWNHNQIVDTFLGMGTIKELGDEETKPLELELFGKKKEAEVKKPGKLFVELTSSLDLTGL